jgi:hypothetical protein
MMKSEEKSQADQDEQIRNEKGRAELEQRDQADQRNNGDNGGSKYDEVKERVVKTWDMTGNINPNSKERVGDM